MDDDEQLERFKIELSGGGISLKREIAKDVARQVLDLVMGGASASDAPASAGRSGASQRNDYRSAQVPVSLREYLDRVRAKTKPEQMVAIGNYVLLHEGASDFDREVIRSKFAEAREPLPTNFPRDWAAAEKHGWIARAPGKDAKYYVTKTGSDYLSGRTNSADD